MFAASEVTNHRLDNKNFLPVLERYGWLDPQTFDSEPGADDKLIAQLHRDLAEEALDSSAALQAADEKVYNSFDKARSEAEFRFYVMFPALALAIATAWSVRDITWMLSAAVLILGACVSIALGVKGAYKLHEATDITVAAIRARVFRTRTMDQLERLKPKKNPKRGWRS